MPRTASIRSVNRRSFNSRPTTCSGRSGALSGLGGSRSAMLLTAVRLELHVLDVDDHEHGLDVFSGCAACSADGRADLRVRGLDVLARTFEFHIQIAVLLSSSLQIDLRVLESFQRP